MSTINPVRASDAYGFAPADVGSLLRCILDESDSGRVIWYEKQYRDAKRDYILWRRIEQPDADSLTNQPVSDDWLGQDSDDLVDTMIHGKRRHFSTLIESQLDRLREMCEGRGDTLVKEWPLEA